MLSCKNWMYAAPCLGSVEELALKTWRQVSWPAPHWLQHSGKHPCTSPEQNSRTCPDGVGMGELTWGHREVEQVAGSIPSWERERWQTGELVSLGELMLPLANCHRQKCWPHPLSESWPWWQGFRRAINSATTEGQIRGCELSYFNIYPKYELLELIKGPVLQPKLQNLHQHRATTGHQRGVLVKLQYWWCGVEEARNLVILISSLFLKFTK